MKDSKNVTEADKSRQVTAAQDLALARLVSGGTDSQAAEAAGVTRQTVNAWKNSCATVPSRSVMERPGGSSGDELDVDVGAVAVPGLAADLGEAGDVATQVGHRQAALVVVEGLVGQRGQHRVDELRVRHLSLIHI